MITQKEAIGICDVIVQAPVAIKKGNVMPNELVGRTRVAGELIGAAQIDRLAQSDQVNGSDALTSATAERASRAAIVHQL